MKPGTILVNAAHRPDRRRGRADHGVRAGTLAGAGLDVFATEPAGATRARSFDDVFLSHQVGPRPRRPRRTSRRRRRQPAPGSRRSAAGRLVEPGAGVAAMSTPVARLRDIWDGRPTYGGWCTMPGTVNAEIVGRAGYDWVCIDTQHGLIGYDSMLLMLQALSAAGSPTIVVSMERAGVDHESARRGCRGDHPHGQHGRGGASRSRRCRYPPDGYRSLGPIRTADDHPVHGENGQDVVCAVMCETVEDRQPRPHPRGAGHRRRLRRFQ